VYTPVHDLRHADDARHFLERALAESLKSQCATCKSQCPTCIHALFYILLRIGR
jgi:xanthine dehydrogenase iron-sulfur cluster and FAD-binding subunit A